MFNFTVSEMTIVTLALNSNLTNAKFKYHKACEKHADVDILVDIARDEYKQAIEAWNTVATNQVCFVEYVPEFGK